MDGNEFQQFVVEKLMNIENRLTSLEARMQGYEKLTKILIGIAAVIAAKLGVDLSGILGG